LPIYEFEFSSLQCRCLSEYQTRCLTVIKVLTACQIESRHR